LELEGICNLPLGLTLSFIHIGLPEVNDFALLAAIGPILRQSSVASRLGLAAIRGRSPGGSSDLAGEHARFKQS
jgi:hypothetical protein